MIRSLTFPRRGLSRFTPKGHAFSSAHTLPQMDSSSLILSNSELTTIVCALLEPQENQEIRRGCQILAGKLQPYLSSGSPFENQVISFAGVSPSLLSPYNDDPGEHEHQGSSLELGWNYGGGKGGGVAGGVGGGGGGGGEYPRCNRGGGKASLLQGAANRSREEDQQRRRGYLEDTYLQQPLSNASSETFYPSASCIPVGEDPPVDDTMRLFLCAVLSQAKSCLPGLSATHKIGVTAPDLVLKYLTEGKGASILTKDSSAASTGSPKDDALQKILFTVRVCGEAEVTDSILQLDYWLSTIKLSCLVNK